LPPPDAARIMAGGTDLLVQMRSGAVRPGLIVDIKKIAEMTTIEETAEGGFRVGAACRVRCWPNTRASARSGPAYLKPST